MEDKNLSSGPLGTNTHQGIIRVEALLIHRIEISIHKTDKVILFGKIGKDHLQHTLTFITKGGTTLIKTKGKISTSGKIKLHTKMILKNMTIKTMVTKISANRMDSNMITKNHIKTFHTILDNTNPTIIWEIIKVAIEWLQTNLLFQIMMTKFTKH